MLSKFSVKKPLTIVVSMILIVLLGVISFTKMTTDLLPSIDLPYVMVMTTYPGASPEKIEIALTKPLEQVLSTTSGVKNITSISSENSSMIILEFEQSVNMDSVMLEMSGYIDLVKAQLDDSIGTPMLMKMNPDMLPVMATSIDYNGMDIKEISKFVDEKIIPEFERVEGVASVSATGIVEEQVRVTLDNNKINEINNKVLASIDDKLAENERKLQEAKVELENAKNILETQSIEQNIQLVDGSIALEDGKKQLQDALNSLPQTKSELEKKKEELSIQKNLLEELIKFQEENEIPVSEEEREVLEQFNTGITAIESAITQINEQKPGLESSLQEVINNQKSLEIGKITLNQELAKAQATIADSEAELNKGMQEFEKAKEEAYKNAGIKDIVTTDTISNILMAENFSMPAGYIIEGEEKYLVKVGDKFKSIEELQNLLLFNIDIEGVGKIKLSDIAKIELSDNSNEMYAKINGNDAVILSFQKQSTSPTAEVSKKINKTIDNLMEKDENLHITSLQDQGIYINIVVNSVLSNLIFGGILAVIILFIFLKNIRPTIIIAFSIPISLLFALALMYFSGVTMNIISLSGLALGVGMLVDNSIVVIENIYRLRNEGMSAAGAAVKGATQVSGAIFASTLTTVCVFLPIVFTDGLSRQLFTDMGLTIAYSLMSSLIIALTLVPAMAATMLKNTTEKQYKFFESLINYYEKLLRIALNKKVYVIVTVVALLVVSTYFAIANGTTLMPTMDSNQLSLTMEMDKDTTTSDIREMSNTIIDRLSTIEDVETIGAMENSGSSLFSSGNNKSISMYIILKENKKLTSIEVGDLIKEKTKDLNCELAINTSNMDMSALGGSGIEIVIKGNNLDVIKGIAKDMGGVLSDIEGAVEINDGLEEATKETRITVDKNKAMEHGLTVAQVYQEISKAILEENKSTELNLASNDYPVILVKDAEITRANVGEHKIKTTENGEEKEIRISDIATVSEEEGLQAINRDNQVRTLYVTAAIDSNYNIGLVSDKVQEKIDSYNAPNGYTITLGGEKEAIDKAFGDLFTMIALAIAFIYLIMVAQFQSFLSPAIVMFTIPLAFTGGFLALIFTGSEVSMIALLGFLVLSGVIVNNGIVFVDYVNQLRLEGVEKSEALVLAGRTRIRPILMTALTTILGLSTLALGVGMGAEMVQPMATVTIGGLIYATLLTLFVVPIMYDVLHRKEIKKVDIDV